MLTKLITKQIPEKVVCEIIKDVTHIIIPIAHRTRTKRMLLLLDIHCPIWTRTRINRSKDGGVPFTP